MFVSDKQRRHRIARAGAIQALPSAACGQQAVRLACVLQYGGRPFTAQEFRQLTPESRILTEASPSAAAWRRARCRLCAVPAAWRSPRSRRRAVSAKREARIAERANVCGRATKDDGVLEFALQCCQFGRGPRSQDHNVAFDFAVRAWCPAQGSETQRATIV